MPAVVSAAGAADQLFLSAKAPTVQRYSALHSFPRGPTSPPAPNGSKRDAAEHAASWPRSRPCSWPRSTAGSRTSPAVGDDVRGVACHICPTDTRVNGSTLPCRAHARASDAAGRRRRARRGGVPPVRHVRLPARPDRHRRPPCWMLRCHGRYDQAGPLHAPSAPHPTRSTAVSDRSDAELLLESQRQRSRATWSGATLGGAAPSSAAAPLPMEVFQGRAPPANPVGTAPVLT